MVSEYIAELVGVKSQERALSGNFGVGRATKNVKLNGKGRKMFRKRACISGRFF